MKMWEKELNKPYKSIYHWKAYKKCVMMVLVIKTMIIKTCQKYTCWHHQNFEISKFKQKNTCVQNFHFKVKHSFQKLFKTLQTFAITSFIFFLQNWSSTIIQDSVTKFAYLLNLHISSNFLIVNSSLTKDYVINMSSYKNK